MESKRVQKLDIFKVTVVVVAGHVPRFAIMSLTRAMRKAIPGAPLKEEAIAQCDRLRRENDDAAPAKGPMVVALLLNMELPGSGVARVALLLPWVVPSYVVGLLWGFMWLRDQGIINHFLVDIFHLSSSKPFWLIGPNTFWAIAIPTIWRSFPFSMITVNFAPYLCNSLIICASTMVIAVLFSTFAGYALARFRFPGSGLFGNAVLATQLIPGIMMLLPIYLDYVYIQQRFGIRLINTYAGMILIYSAFFVPWSIWIIRSFFASIPRELEQAALIDGCTPFGALWRVIIPLAMPGIIATGIYVFLAAWDELLFAWVLASDTSTQTIPVGLRLYVGNYQNRYDLVMAAATVVTIPVAIMFFAMQRYIISGLTGGAVKG